MRPAAPPRGNGLRHARRAVQVAALLLWLALFIVTRDPAHALVRADLFLVTDPLVALLTLGASRLLVPVMLVSLGLLAATLVFGRAFCGWLCPLGTVLDATAKVLRPPEQRFSRQTHERMQRWKYYLLLVMGVGALFSAQWVYLLDPLVLLFRALAAGVWPVLTAMVPSRLLPEALRESYHGIAALPVLLLIGVLALTALTPRFWCRYLCPLGALYGLFSRAPLLRRRVKGCDVCTGLAGRQCISGCRMGAVPAKPAQTQNHECIRCFTGRSECHTGAIRFDWVAPGVEKVDVPLDLARRRFVTLGVATAACAPLVALSAYHRDDPRAVVRPPRVFDEDTFLDQCVRCAMCVQACPTQTLQLTHLEAGLAGLWTPAITPRVGGCIADCNACSVACPTDAIPEFAKTEAEKWPVKMGTAVLEKNRCISWADNLPCRKCIDICPTRAFVIEPAAAGHPLRPASIDYARCTGCGLCEHACIQIVFGTPALLTFSHGRGQPTSLLERPTTEVPKP